MVETTMVALDGLRHGHEANPPLNARKSDRETNIEGLTASILAKGVRIPVAGCQIDGLVFVTDGNRRLRALRQLAADGKISASHPVAVILHAPGEGLEWSLMANVLRESMHPIDEFEAFHALSTGPNARSVEQISNHFGLTVRQVRQRLALGNLAPEIRAAWRNGMLSTDEAHCFTLASSREQQQQVFAKLSIDGARPTAQRIRAEIVGDTSRLTKSMNFVGAQAYVFGGGRLVDDLFGDRPVILDPDILERLSAEKMQEHVEAFRAHGWSWVKLAAEAPKQAYMWPRVTPAEILSTVEQEHAKDVLKEQLQTVGEMTPQGLEIERRLEDLDMDILIASFTAEDKRRSGVLLDVQEDGRLNIRPGMIWDGHQAVAEPMNGKAPANATERPSPAEVTIPPVVRSILLLTQTRAIASVVASDPGLALLIACLAGFRGTSLIPVHYRPEGAFEGPILGEEDVLNRPDVIEHFQALRDEPGRLERLFATLVAAAVDVRLAGADRDGVRPISAASVERLVSLLPVDAYHNQVMKQFDVADYFKRSPRAVSEAALREMGVELPPPSARKGDVAKKAATHARIFTWLPSALRVTRGTLLP